MPTRPVPEFGADAMQVVYRVPRTIVRVTGKVTRRIDMRTGQERTVSDPQIALGVEADPSSLIELAGLGSPLARRDLEISFTDDGRIAKATGTSVGAGPAIVEALTRVVTMAVSVGVSILRTAAGPQLKELDEAPAEPWIESQYRAAFPDEARARAAAKAAVHALVLRAAAVAVELGATADETLRAQRAAQLRDLHGALGEIRQQAELYEQHFALWRASAFAPVEETHDISIPLADLPRLDEAPSQWKRAPAEMGANARLAPFGIALAVAGGTDESSPEFEPQPQSGFYLRVPRRVELAVYQKTADQRSTPSFELIRQVPAWVMDDLCDLEFVRFAGSDEWGKLFEDRALTIETSAVGGLARFKNTEKALAERIAEALRSAPEQATSSLEQTNKLVDQWQALRAQGSEALLADLKRRKELVEADVALSGAVGSRERQERIDALKKQIEELEAQRLLGEKSEALTRANETAELRRVTELAKAELEALKAGRERDVERASGDMRSVKELMTLRADIAQLQKKLDAMAAELGVADGADGG